MGDGRRFETFAKNLNYKFPPMKFKTILVVADGNLELSKELKKYGYENIIVFEPKPRLLKVSKTFLLKIKLIKKWFVKEEKIKADLIVGMHPDEATVEILMWAKLNNKPFAVVPCCILGDKRFTINCHGPKQWIERIRRINEGTLMEILNINGKNVMLFKQKP